MLGNQKNRSRKTKTSRSGKTRRPRGRGSKSVLGGSETKKETKSLKLRNKKTLLLTTLVLIIIEYFFISTVIRTQLYDFFTFQFPIVFIYFFINFRKEKFFLVFYLCTIPFLLVLVSKSEVVLKKGVDLNYTFWVDYEDIPTGESELLKLRDKDVELLVPISSNVLKDNIGYYKADNESFSYELINEENPAWVDSKTLYKNSTVKIAEKWDYHGNVLELYDEGLTDYCSITHYYNRDIINETLEFWLSMAENSGGLNINFYSSEIGLITALGFSPFDVWGAINETDSGILFYNVISNKIFLHVKIVLKNDSLDLYADGKYVGSCLYSCLYHNESVIPNIDCIGFSTNTFQQGSYYIDAVGVTNCDGYVEGANIRPYRTSRYIYDKFNALNRLKIKYSLCLIVEKYANLDNGKELLDLLKTIRSYNFYKYAERIYIDAEIPEERRDRYVLGAIPSDNKYKNSLDIYEAIKDIIEDDNKKLGVIKSLTTTENYEKATRNVPFSDLDVDLCVIMLYRTYNVQYQKNMDFWIYQSAKKENKNYGVFVGSFRKGYSKNDLRRDLTICSSLGKNDVFVYDYKGFSKKCDLDDLKPYKELTIEVSKTDETGYFYAFLGLEFLNVLLFLYFFWFLFTIVGLTLVLASYIIYFTFIERNARSIKKTKAKRKLSVL